MVWFCCVAVALTCPILLKLGPIVSSVINYVQFLSVLEVPFYLIVLKSLLSMEFIDEIVWDVLSVGILLSKWFKLLHDKLKQ